MKKVPCFHWTGETEPGTCALGLHNGKPMRADCKVCKKYRGHPAWQMSNSERAVYFHAETSEPQSDRPLQPGDIVEWVLEKMGAVKLPNCKCAEFKRRMNGLGWLGCLIHRKEIIEWFSQKARDQGLTCPEDSIWSLVLAAIEQLKKKSSHQL